MAQIAIIGGGMSGLCAAVSCANTLKSSIIDADITIFESLDRVGKKILATGNGKCNILNKNATPQEYFGERMLAAYAFSRFPVEDNIKFFEALGLLLTEQDEGRLYPESLFAGSVNDALRLECQSLGINFVCKNKITSISACNGGGYLLNGSYFADAVIVAGGGKSSSVHGSDGSALKLLESLGMLCEPMRPALVALTVNEIDASLKGVRCRGKVSAAENGLTLEETGEIQFTKDGLSGIAVMNISCILENFPAKIRIELLPERTKEEIFSFLQMLRTHNPDLTVSQALCGLLPKMLGIFKAKRSKISPSTPLSSLTDSSLSHLANIIKHEEYTVTGTAGFANAQVSAGGAKADNFTDTLESKNHKGLFACGEILDIYGKCGGYNLSFAVSSGRLAGLSCAKALETEK